MIKDKGFENKIIIYVAAGLCGCVIFLWGWHALGIHFFIQRLYDWKCFSLLNWVAQGKDIHPAQYYFNVADRYLMMAAKYVLVIVLPFLSLLITRSIKNKKVYLYLILVAFLISIAIRLPNLNRPLSDAHEWVTAHTMIVLQNWDLQGSWKSKFCLLTTYPSKANKFIPNLYGRLMNDSGESYYASYPPFAVIFPYIIFKFFLIPINVLNIQLFNLFFHLTSSYFIYAILLKALKEGADRYFAAFIGSMYFIFLPANLWFFSNTYSWDIFWHYLWVIGIFQILQIIHDISTERLKALSLFLLGLNIFLIIYTDYNGIYFALSVIFYILIKFRKSRYFRNLIAYTVVPTFLALAFLIIQYSSISGFKALGQYFWLSRLSYELHGMTDAIQIFKHYQFAYIALPIPIVALLIILLKKNRGFFKQMTKMELALLYFCLFPVILDHCLQPRMIAEHSFRVVKSSLALISILTICFNHFDTKTLKEHMQKILVTGLMVLTLVLPILTYKEHYAYSRNSGRFSILANEIKREVTDDDVIFLITEIGNTPPLVFHAQRNMLSILDREEAQAWLEQYGNKKGIIFYIDDNLKITKTEVVTAGTV